MDVAFSLLGAIWNFFTDPASFLTGAAHWTVGYVMPPDLQTWFLGTLGAPGQTWDGREIYQDLYRVVQGPALLITGVAAGGRVLRATLDHRVAAGHVVLDTLPRLLLAVALIGLPGTGVSAGYVVIAFAVDASISLAHVLFSLLLQAPLFQGPGGMQGWLDRLIAMLLRNAGSTVLVAAALIPLIVLVLYAFVLMVLRTVMLGFCVATAPLCLATAVFDGSNRFFRWWLDLLLGVLAAPAVLGVAIAVSLTLAANIVTAQPPIGPLLAIIVMCGGLWMAAKMVHALTWRHFGHGGAIAGFTAGVTTMLAPLHQLAEVGRLAGTLGGGRDGAGVASLQPSGISGHGGGPGGVAGTVGARAATLAGTASAVMAGGGPPDVAASLGPSGRGAVAGAEGLFSQRAFTAFARSQAGLIGTLTRDLPVGSVASGDRAKVAWERTSAAARREFAEDFLSHWLGDVDGEPGASMVPQPMAAVPA